MASARALATADDNKSLAIVRGVGMKLRFVNLMIVAGAICAHAPVHAASIKAMPGKSGRVVIQVSGVIVAGDAGLFVSAIKKTTDAGKSIESVVLNSSGGSLAEGERLAATIRFARIPTIVPSGAICASACFLAFAAGAPKLAAPDALIGVHKASEKGGRETKASAAATAVMAQLAKELGVPSPIIARMT